MSVGTCLCAVLAVVCLLDIRCAARPAQSPQRHSVAVMALHTQDSTLGASASRVRDTVATCLATDSTWRLIPISATGRPVPPRSTWCSPWCARWGATQSSLNGGAAVVETGELIAYHAVRSARATPDALVAALA